MKRFVFAIVAIAVVSTCGAALAQAKVTINDKEYRDRVYACWLGKNIGGTLGVPFEGKREPQDISFYTNLKPGEPAANDDLDLQILWLKAMEEHGGHVDARILGEYWLKFVPVDWNEYGIGKRHMREGILPPVSGEFDNAKWKTSNGAWIRSEIWACLAPGCPALAAKMAREDACVDHGAAEGTLAEIFTASLESAAWVEPDRDKLIDIGLSMIPKDCGVARAIRAAIDAKKAGKDWKAAREDVIATTEDTGWFQAPRNVAYTMLGWIYGDGDFGKSLCIAVNCGDDTDCTGATLGSIWGIIHGTKGIPEKWSAPIGKKINTVAISGFKAPKDLDELTDKTIAMAKKVLAQENAPVAIADAPSDLAKAGELKLSDPDAARALWDLSPYQVAWNEGDVQVILDYVSGPLVKPNTPHPVKVHVRGLPADAKDVKVTIAKVPENWKVEQALTAATAEPGAEYAITPPAVEPGLFKMAVQVAYGKKTLSIPFTLVAMDGPGDDDLALASKGATTTSDSEYAIEPGCTAKAIDGIVAIPEDFSNRWHSSLDKAHPHWVEVRLPQAVKVGRVVVRFADPQGYPVSFAGMVMPEHGAKMQEMFKVLANTNPKAFQRSFRPVTTDTFRFVIFKSANVAYPNAAQVSEIELYEK